MEYVYDTEEYRDHLATVDKEGKRIWIYPKKPKGRLYNARTWVSIAFLVLFLTLPFIKINGEQILQFNILERKFNVFGLLFSPHDFHIFFLVTITFIVFITLFTVVWGRLFCGWACPQTVFMEMFFRKIEYWIEGDANDQRRLDKAPWTADKIRKKVLKHAIFFAISVVVANYFLAYIIGMDAVLKIISEPISQRFGGFIAMLGFSAIFYGVFARLREQVCTTICPYGRLQGVLLVPDSIVVAYDHVRGEPRGKIKKQKDPVESIQAAVSASPIGSKKTVGDCIDCKLCIAVCPTGIDIRNGTQLECTNCTACIDACDEVMDKVNRPRGLIRYDSMNGIRSGKRQIWTPRTIAYSCVLGILLLLDVILIARRAEVEATILRSPGQMYQQVDEKHISNLYTYQIINKTHHSIPISFRLKNRQGVIKLVGNEHPEATKEKIAEGAFFIQLALGQLRGVKNEVIIEVVSGDKVLDVVKTSFVGPMQ